MGRKILRHVYAILRSDEGVLRDVDSPNITLYTEITVKKIVWTMDRAKAEVARLNELNAAKGCRYWWQTTRLEEPGEDEGVDLPPAAPHGLGPD